MSVEVAHVILQILQEPARYVGQSSHWFGVEVCVVPRPKDVLSPGEYRNYRKVRAVSVCLIILGCILLVGGVWIALNGDPGANEADDPGLAAGVAAVGLAGAIGGIAAFHGRSRWAPLAKVMACLYLGIFPIGTILGYLLLDGLPQYLNSVEHLRRMAAEVLDWDEEEPEYV